MSAMKKRPAASQTPTRKRPANSATRKLGENYVDYAGGLKKFGTARDDAKGRPASTSCISSCTLALHLTPAGVELLSGSQDTALAKAGVKKKEFEKRLAEAWNTSPGCVESRLRYSFVAFSLAFPQNDVFFQGLTQLDWQVALEEAHPKVNMFDLPGAQHIVQVGSCEATLFLHVYPAYWGALRRQEDTEGRLALDVNKVASKLWMLKGGDESEASIAQRLQIRSSPSYSMRLQVQIEASGPLEKLDESVLRDAAVAAGLLGASFRSELVGADTVGRFECECLQSKRVGCSLCGAGPMLRWCWHAHALSRQHLSNVQRNGS